MCNSCRNECKNVKIYDGETKQISIFVEYDVLLEK